jgi:16S rRNA A1518/A1519 N6-dimethyltransferase RsmA/KsgA/DIM1 with predicted DNA glycosylase/AP lyase activity
MFLDIEPEHPDVLQQDYLDFRFENNLEKKVHIVGNPPFGRQSSLCIKFIKNLVLFVIQ